MLTELGTEAVAPPDRWIVREVDSLDVHVVEGGVCYRFPDEESLHAIGKTVDDAEVVPPGTLASFPAVPRDEALIHERGIGRTFILLGGVRFAITTEDMRALRRTNLEVVCVPRGVLSHIPYGGPYTGRLRSRYGPVIVAARRLRHSSGAERWAGRFEGALVGVVASVIVALGSHFVG